MARRSADLSASAEVAAVRDDPAGRLRLLQAMYDDPLGRDAVRLPFRRAAVAFMRWQLRRGLLNPVTSETPGSPWWRAVNERLLLDTCEARMIFSGALEEPSSASVQAGVEFARRPTAQSWYRAHNMTIVSAYVEHTTLADGENRDERFVLNVVLLRLLYAHALVAAPRLALGWLSPVAPLLGDPRLGMTGIFLSLSRVLPDRYPLSGDLLRFVQDESGFGRFLDIGVIQPRLRRLYDWSASELGIPAVASLLDGDIPAYAWDPNDREPWLLPPTRIARWTRAALPVR
jgi:hypothetical protein